MLMLCRHVHPMYSLYLSVAKLPMKHRETNFFFFKLIAHILIYFANVCFIIILKYNIFIKTYWILL